MLSKTICYFSLLASVIFGSQVNIEKHGGKVCYGPKGRRGMNGLVGPHGPQGPQGFQGPQGPQGDVGHGRIIYCAKATDADLIVADNESVPFEYCYQSEGFQALPYSSAIRLVQVLEAGTYKITFFGYGVGGSYVVNINGSPASPNTNGGTFDGTGSEYVHGQFVVVLNEGDVISVVAVGSNTLEDADGAVAASLMVARVA